MFVFSEVEIKTIPYRFVEVTLLLEIVSPVEDETKKMPSLEASISFPVMFVSSEDDSK